MTRDQFLRVQAEVLDNTFSLTAGEEAERLRFEEMAVETYGHLAAANSFVTAFKVEVDSAFNFLNFPKTAQALVPSMLLQRWEDWKRDYPALLERNPRLKLHDMMHAIAETDVSSSWPAGLEGAIQDWVDANDSLAPPPFDDRWNIVTPAFYQNLRTLRERIDGWLYLDGWRVIFASEAEWQAIRATRETAMAERLESLRDAVSRSEKAGAILRELVKCARADAVFWEALKSWELARETSRPPKPSQAAKKPSRGTRSRWIVHERGPVIKPVEKRLPDPPLDPIFSRFVALAIPNDGAVRAESIVIALRNEIRRELGLDSLLVWSGGPGIALK